MVAPTSHLTSQILRQPIHSWTCNFVGTTRHQWRLPVPNMKLLHQFYCFYARKCVHVSNCFYNHHWHNVISVSFTEILPSCGYCTKLDTRNWNTNWSYWISRAQEKSLGWSSSRIWHRNSSRDRCVFKMLKCVKCFCYTVLYG